MKSAKQQTVKKSPPRIIVIPHYGGTKKMSDVFESIITEQVRNKLGKAG